MPHVTIEYSVNLSGRLDVQGLCDVVHGILAGCDLFELGALRVRALPCAEFSIADRLPQNAFVDIVLRMGAGRSPDDRQGIGRSIFEAASAFVQPLLDEPHFALSLEIREIDPVLSWKRNAMHSRLRAATS